MKSKDEVIDRKKGGSDQVSKNKTGHSNWFVIVMFLLAVWFSYKFVEQQTVLNDVSYHQSMAQVRLSEAQERNKALRVERDSLNDGAYIEKVAREDLGMTRQGEMPYISARR